MPWKRKLLGAHYLVMSSAGFVWTGTWRLNWVDGISILQHVATSSVVSASALSLEILKIAQFVWKKLTAISTTEFIYNVCFVAQDRQTPWLDFSTSLRRNYGVVGVQCSELRKSDFKHCSLECMKTLLLLTNDETAFLFLRLHAAGLDFCCYSESETGGCPQSNFPFFFSSHSNQFLTGHMWAFWIM